MKNRRAFGAAIIAIAALTPSTSHALPREAIATEIAFVTVALEGAGSHLKIDCDPNEDSFEIIQGYVEWLPTVLSPVGWVEKGPGIWSFERAWWMDKKLHVASGGDDQVAIAGDYQLGQEDTRELAPGHWDDGGLRWYGTSIHSDAPAEGSDLLFMVASFGGRLGNCSSTFNGTPVEVHRLSGGHAGWRDLGGVQNPIWIYHEGQQVGLGNAFTHALAGGAYMGWLDPGGWGQAGMTVWRDGQTQPEGSAVAYPSADGSWAWIREADRAEAYVPILQQSPRSDRAEPAPMYYWFTLPPTAPSEI